MSFVYNTSISSFTDGHLGCRVIIADV